MKAQVRKQADRASGKRQKAAKPAEPAVPSADKPSKLEQIVSMLTKPSGASLADLTAATRWQPHSVRGALAGALKKKGHVVVSEKIDGVRLYRIQPTR